MSYLIGFIIALFITLTGVGAGTITVPVLVLFLGVPAPVAVSIGLMFAAVVKLILVPAQVIRGNVAWRTLGYMLLGGLPGVLLGSLYLKHLVTAGSENVINAILGVILVTTAAWQIVFSFRPVRPRSEVKDRSHWLSWLMFPVGAEVGFSSAGAGALGSAALLSLTPLAPAQVVGTDIAFGFVVSLIGSGAHWFAPVRRDSAPATDRRRHRGRHRRNAGQHAHSAPAVALCAMDLASGARRAIPVQQLQGMESARQRSRASLHRGAREVNPLRSTACHILLSGIRPGGGDRRFYGSELSALRL